MARPTAEEGASRQATAKEQQLSEMRRARRDADDAHQVQPLSGTEHDLAGPGNFTLIV